MILHKYLITAAVALSATALSAAELVTNGDFSAGNTGFATTYSYVDYSAVAGTYNIGGNAVSLCGCWANLGDHTSGVGKYMILDGAQSGLDFFDETFDIVANSTYTLSFWAAQLGGGPAATIVAAFNNVQLGGGFTPSGTAWEHYSFTFNTNVAGSVTTGTIGLRDIATGTQYNDFAIDDVSFTGAAPTAVGGVPEPATWALLIGGFALTGMAVRRRERRAVVA